MTSSSRPVSALILAGRRNRESDPLAGLEGAPHKAFLRAGDRPLIARVIDALQASGRVGDIRITAPDDIHAALHEALAGRTGWRIVAPAASPAATILAALDETPAQTGLLATTCDHALLSPGMVSEFLDAANTAPAAAGCVERARYEARFPGSRRTFVELSDFSFSGANLFWFAGGEARNLAAYWRRLEQKRKKPLSMALEIGLLPGLLFLMGRISKAGLEKTIARKTGVAARLVSLSAPEAAIDVDKPQDLELVRRILKEASAANA